MQMGLMAILMKDLLVISVAETGLWSSMFPSCLPCSANRPNGLSHFSKTDAQLDDIKKHYLKGNPVWTSVTINFEVPDETDFMTWTTNNGEVRVTPLVHACVVTGYDKENIYVNDPYGVKIEQYRSTIFRRFSLQWVDRC